VLEAKKAYNEYISESQIKKGKEVLRKQDVFWGKMITELKQRYVRTLPNKML
jgi:hypothetical protein